MHVQAVGAAVDLRRAHLDEVVQRAVEARLTGLTLKPEHGLHDPGEAVHEIESGCHVVRLQVLAIRLDQDPSKEQGERKEVRVIMTPLFNRHRGVADGPG
jgi:hypothetical protein